MAKLTAPLLSLDARGQIGSAIVYSYWRGVQYARVRVIPKLGTDAGQVAARLLITDASKAWKNEDSPIDTAYKAAYNLAAQGQKYSGFNLFMMDCFPKNGGNAYAGSFTAPTAPGDQTP
jgi:hypothetical protein